MKKTLLLAAILCLYITNLNAQSSRQIASRGIKTVETKITELKKGQENVSYIRSTYDKKGRLLAEYKFDGDSVCVAVETNTYNRKGDLTEQIIYRGNKEQIQEKTQIQYDRFNRDTLKTEYDDKGVKSLTRYIYDNLDNKIQEITTDGTGKVIRQVVMTYDKRGMLLTRTITNDQGKITYQKKNDYTY